MTTLKIAARNILRNLRRSLMTVSAIAVGAMALLLFGGFTSHIFVALETQNVTRSGHLAVFRNGYFKYGVGNPASYGIDNYQAVLALIGNDPVLKPMINVVTPTINLFGIAGNFEAQASKTFFGLGVVPADYNKMRRWNEHHLDYDPVAASNRINEQDESHGFIGVGLARMLGLCEALHLGDCPKGEGGDQPAAGAISGPATRDFSALEGEAKESASGAPNGGEPQSAPRLDLLAATAAGAPNVVNFYVDKAISQGVKEYDDALVVMNFNLAQRLLYGRGEKKAVGIVVQLHRTEDIPVARARLERLIRENHLDLETKELNELQPFYKQAVGMFVAIFSFISVVMAVIVLFTVVNTMSMSVMERTQEIGTLRALGVKKKGITLQFILEGAILGVIGATLGIILGYLASYGVNHAGLTWHPPGQSHPTNLIVRTRGVEHLIFEIWLGLCAMATVAAWIPARRAARMKIVDALGHV
ncbi:FtsX-like permease family protein [Geomonas sp. RF6]|uniref:ABC transporter permease n=1 Tax=Geomonas sp. RF6 TaxID=2897342 RepID=UPI001E54A6C0|nr:FtsX-like permease family protein [Geomonas sp. RF6]UFS70634.1 FtsX-like permease family protein [Geomonas sp. RF6]